MLPVLRRYGLRRLLEGELQRVGRAGGAESLLLLSYAILVVRHDPHLARLILRIHPHEAVARQAREILVRAIIDRN